MREQGRMQKILLIVLGFAVALVTADPAEAKRRIALVIGNSAYTQISALTNPKNDAQAMADALRLVGFEVTVATDASLLDMNRAIREFGKQLRAAGRDAVGLFYYAGHGVQSRDANFLVPLGADIEAEADLELEAVSASTILSQMEAAGNALNLVILDACRNNPFKSNFRSATRGLARVQAASGTLVAFAAAPGQVAADGTGSNSPYTSALVAAMQQPGLSVEQVFKRVRISVERETGGQQTPWEESSLTGNFEFVPSTETSQPAPEAPQPVAPPQPAADREVVFWQSVKDSDNPAMFRAYLKQYPEGVFAGIAKVRLEELEQQTAAADPVTPAPAPETAPSPSNGPDKTLVLAIQRELDRHNCGPGAIDGDWGRRSERALSRFAGLTRLRLTSLDPTPQVLNELKARSKPVCPLQCGDGEELRNGRCVATSCGPGLVLSADGVCREAAKPRASAVSVVGTWAYNGTCAAFKTSGTTVLRKTGPFRFAGTHASPTGVTGTVRNGRIKGTLVTYTARYKDIFGKSQTERFTGHLSADGSQIKGAIVGGWGNGCQMVLTRQ